MTPPTEAGQAYFTELFRYNDWATRRIIDALEETEADVREGDALAHACRLLGHLVRAQEVWLGRIQETADATLPIWEETDVRTAAERSEASTKAWLDFLSSSTASDFAADVRYQNSKGQPFTNTLRQIAAHVINHSTHHRAQIALLLRQADFPPPATDYIFYARSAS
ncbi:MAG: DinB family protein [Rhodothermales bacterium]